MVIQGMESSLGDVHFIRRLHARCEQESGLVLKRYMKFRHIKNTINLMKNSTGTGTGSGTLSGISGISGNKNSGNVKNILPSEIHTILDELALLIQYCCVYSKYIKQLADGAEKRKRSTSTSTSTSPTKSNSIIISTTDITEQQKNNVNNKNNANNENNKNENTSISQPDTANNNNVNGKPIVTAFSVFLGPIEFDKMVDELINR